MSKLRDLVNQHRASIQNLSAVYSGHPAGIWQCNAKLITSTGYTVCHNDDPEAGMVEALERSVRTLAICGGVSGLKNQSKPVPKPKPPPVEEEEDLLGADEDLLGEDEEEDLLG